MQLHLPKGDKREKTAGTSYPLILFSALCLTASNGRCEPTGAAPPPPRFFHGCCPAAMVGDGQHLYVTAGGKVLEYKLEGMTIEHSADFPACPPPGMKGKKMAEGHFPPMPPPPPPQGVLWAGNGRLYVLAGPAIYVYKTPGLSLQNTVKLPMPKPPQAEQ